ncbi:unnamed protein product [Caenorhabditis bovis]|uniref:Uncharacterized protein n=1 Tax=Caenorhabditis bovis TaxID=2654633 RepID=A0A8S1F0X0_9PELO|nr:unnamed protein product [Caenorhabditis bovis]
MSSNSDSKAAVLSLKIHDSFRDAKFDKDFTKFENGPQPSPTVDKAKEEALERMRQLEGVVDTSIDTHPNKPTIRGRRQYDKPHGCYRLAIKAAGKFENDTWLTKNGNPFEWAVAYIPTDSEEITKILENGFEPGIGGNIVTPDAKTANKFASDFMFKNHKYKLIFQVRAKPQEIRMVKSANSESGELWKLRNPSDIRIYGICCFPTANFNEPAEIQMQKNSLAHRSQIVQSSPKKTEISQPVTKNEPLPDNHLRLSDIKSNEPTKKQLPDLSERVKLVSTQGLANSFLLPSSFTSPPRPPHSSSRSTSVGPARSLMSGPGESVSQPRIQPKAALPDNRRPVTLSSNGENLTTWKARSRSISRPRPHEYTDSCGPVKN